MRSDLKAIEMKKMEGVLLQARDRWPLEGEEVNKYFCNLEKRLIL